MKRNKFFSRFIVVTLTAALLFVSRGRAIPVSALADPVQAIAPVYDTQIYQLQDYIENGGMSAGQLDIFYTLAGFYVLGQAGSSGYRLVDPYSNSDAVWDWLKSCGIEIYNTVIGLVPDTARMPITGDLYSTIPFKKASQLYVATLMGAAVKAATFSSYQDFKDEVTNSQSYYLPWNLDVQKGMNSIFGIYDGIYNWQFDTKPFTSNVVYKTTPLTVIQQSQYDGYVAQMGYTVRANLSSASTVNVRFGNTSTFEIYNNLYINTSNNTISVVDSSGNAMPRTWGGLIYVSANNGSVNYQPNYNSIGGYMINTSTYNPSSYSSYVDIVRDVYNDVIHLASDSGYYLYLEDFIQHVYVGSNWLNKSEIYNVTNLNIDDTYQQYYNAVPEEHDYLLDIKGILQDILNNTDLFNTFINNLVDINGVPVHDDNLIRITTNIYDLLEQTNPILPVNLNDISEYTNNTYMDLVKERATAAGNTLASLVAFWHNCDAELIYVLFGAGLTILVGAFIGKWGHS